MWFTDIDLSPFYVCLWFALSVPEYTMKGCLLWFQLPDLCVFSPFEEVPEEPVSLAHMERWPGPEHSGKKDLSVSGTFEMC